MARAPASNRCGDVFRHGNAAELGREWRRVVSGRTKTTAPSLHRAATSRTTPFIPRDARTLSLSIHEMSEMGLLASRVALSAAGRLKVITRRWRDHREFDLTTR